MNLERLKLWREALLDAEAKGRKFDFDVYVAENRDSPCGFTACLAGDLALYEPAQKLGFSFSVTRATWAPPVGSITYGRDQQDSAIKSFLGVESAIDRIWVERTIIPELSNLAYGKTPRAVTRADGLARINEKIAELEAAAEPPPT